jgi:hypothetical protein
MLNHAVVQISRDPSPLGIRGIDRVLEQALAVTLLRLQPTGE